MQQQTRKRTGVKQKNIIPFIPEGDFFFTKGVEAFQNRKFEAAVKWLKKALERKPREPLYACQLSVVYTEIGSYHEANQVLTEVLEASEYVDCYYLLANNYAHLGLLNDANKYATIYLDKQPDGDFAQEAERLLKLIDIEEEDEDEDNWDLEDEDDLLIYQETVFYHMENRDWEKAIPLLEDLMVIFPEHTLARHDYAQALFFSGSTEEAIQLELNIMEEDPASLYGHANLALFYYETGQTKSYKRHIQALLNVYPIHDQQKLKVAYTLARTGWDEEACRRFRALRRSMGRGHLSYYRGYSAAAHRIGKVKRAAALWAEGCKLHPQLANEKEPWL
ncbi:tetratricopeptide repeat protein [Lentibacillus sediminis]|uniref:tetratricopeptide repeat protein n=1 Tax=Lentibacillus sediminis TaxID=1940529 RepID=UPI000C1BEF0D|nr:tetratricopeptide repeat protein [Lentibacillus sediminis]